MDVTPQLGSIWRFDLRNGAAIDMPAGAKVLSVAWHAGGLKLWAIVDPEIPKVRGTVRIVSTGCHASDAWRYVGTVTHDGRVYHCFLEDV